jgi:hypothetical protein
MEDENVSGQIQWTADDTRKGKPLTRNEQNIHDYHNSPLEEDDRILKYSRKKHCQVVSTPTDQ